MVLGQRPGILKRLAAMAPVRVFAISGSESAEIETLIADLELEQEIVLTDSPRSANVLLAMGEFPGSMQESARRIHDQLCGPRRTLWLRQNVSAPSEAIFPKAIREDTHCDLALLLRKIHRDLLTGVEPSEEPILPDEEPALWRGVGPYGQGGTGMTGGVPYGRPMPETAPDRDGLALDQLSVRVGPFFRPFPSGLTLALKLQGDVIQEAAVAENPFDAKKLNPDFESGDPFIRALSEPVPVVEMEMARARHHLHWLCNALQVHGLGALGLRTRAIARSLSPGMIAPIAQLRKILRYSRSVSLVGAGVGVIQPDKIRDRGLGPVARAAGLREDLRMTDPAYQELGFEPVVHAENDVRSRLWQRLDEAMQSVTLAARSGNATSGGGGRVEGPRGVITLDGNSLPLLLGLLPDLLYGLEWGDAVATVVSLDLDLRDVRSQRVS